LALFRSIFDLFSVIFGHFRATKEVKNATQMAPNGHNLSKLAKNEQTMTAMAENAPKLVETGQK